MQKLNIDSDKFDARGILASISNAKNNFEDAETFRKDTCKLHGPNNREVLCRI